MSGFQFAFPTGIDRRDDPGTPDHFDVYCGMVDEEPFEVISGSEGLANGKTCVHPADSSRVSTRHKV